ncbi:MAG: excinuclease ABC subunit UvrB [Candidatus Azambacteria bacterium]|nr:excinuclease ABC subunit UvrB [Candidatus Azambacteria bacterium]
MSLFKINSTFTPAGDQPTAIAALSSGIEAGATHQTLVGVTGSGKTFTAAHVIARTQRPTLVISHNKTLAYQLYQEFKSFFPENSVHYFVSYYDYYQPEAYMPRTDTYIDKDVKINEELDRLRHEATQSILSRDDVIVIASVSCIYNIGAPANYESLSVLVSRGQTMKQKELLSHLVALQYQRNEIETVPGIFRAHGEVIEVRPSTGNDIIRIIFGKTGINHIHVAANELTPHWREIEHVRIFPAKFWLAETKTIPLAVANIENELAEQVRAFTAQGKLLEAQRIEQRTRFDLEMLTTAGYCHGIENYSRQIEFREPDSPPFTLIDYFAHAYGKDFLILVDEAHMTISQIRGMYFGDKARKDTLINYGFRLPSARDNRPLRIEEFERRVPQTIYMSATPAPYELAKSKGHIVEQIVRPTGLLDPVITVRSAEHQVRNSIQEIKKRVAKNQRVFVTTLTKRMAEDLAEFLKENGVKAHFLHSEVKTLERTDTLHALRLGEYDVIVGVNLLREGLDIPEVSLVIIMDADKEGFLRNKTTLIQTMGRAARHLEGEVIMYADTMTRSMKEAIEETNRRRTVQEHYNTTHGITPSQIQKPLRERMTAEKNEVDLTLEEMGIFSETKDIKKLIAHYTKEMKHAAQELDFQNAERLKNIIKKLKKFA